MVTVVRWHRLPGFRSGTLSRLSSIAFAFVATHNHFVLDRGGKVFKQSAPVIKLPAGASEDDHLALLGVLNSSTACFWLKQVCHDKGSQRRGRGLQRERLGDRSTSSPAPSWSSSHSRPISPSSAAATSTSLPSSSPPPPPTRLPPPRPRPASRLAAAHAEWLRLHAEMISEQEELDWDVYRLYGLLSDAEAAEVLGDGSADR